MYYKLGWWFPDEDTHFSYMLEKNILKGIGPVYQEAVRIKSIELVKNKIVALDIGANIGLWTKDLTKFFNKVIAVEPIVEFQDCLKKNVELEKLEILPIALGMNDTKIDMILTNGNTGHSHVNLETFGKGKIEMKRLDSMNFERIDYIKIDCEGYELNILKGAEKTIKRHKPIIVVEQKLHVDTGVTQETQFSSVELLRSWGANILGQVRHDCILGF
jgi:FkbM family methyltransferase